MHGPSHLPARPGGVGTGPRRTGQGWGPGTWARTTLRPSPRTPQAVQCDVSVEEDNHQEWTFTLYGFDNSGKATREVTRPGSHPGDTAGPSRREERQGAFLGQAVGRGHCRTGPRSPAGLAGASSILLGPASVCAIPGGAQPALAISALASSPSAGQ